MVLSTEDPKRNDQEIDAELLAHLPPWVRILEALRKRARTVEHGGSAGVALNEKDQA